MLCWVFHEEKLDSALAAREARRVKEGATEQQARDETFTIRAFLAESAELQMQTPANARRT
jgi:hypothetical protein